MVSLFVGVMVVVAVCSARGLNLFLYVLCVGIIILFMRFVIVWSVVWELAGPKTSGMSPGGVHEGPGECSNRRRKAVEEKPG